MKDPLATPDFVLYYAHGKPNNLSRSMITYF